MTNSASIYMEEDVRFAGIAPGLLSSQSFDHPGPSTREDAAQHYSLRNFISAL
jgi:hypothetical protein